MHYNKVKFKLCVCSAHMYIAKILKFLDVRIAMSTAKEIVCHNCKASSSKKEIVCHNCKASSSARKQCLVCKHNYCNECVAQCPGNRETPNTASELPDLLASWE